MELLERDAILAELHRLLGQARDGYGALVMLGGEAGAGKTSLVRRFIEETGAAATVLLGQCDALSTPRALGPLFDIAGLDPVLRQLVKENAPRDQLFAAVLGRLKAGGRPVLLAIEDAHWADEATLDLVHYLGRRVEATRSLVIVTYRDDEVGPRHPFRRVLGDLVASTAVYRLSVPPLTLDGVTALAAGSGIDPTALFAQTRGNPFFVTAVIAAGGGIPPTVRDAVLARASRLSPAAWAMLETAAIIGSTIDPDLLIAVTGPAIEAIEACLENGILEDCGHVLTFRHELAREAVASAISPMRRKMLHALVLRHLAGSRDGALDSARLAYHAEEAGDPAAVVHYAPEAARRAAVLRSHREAAEQFARALRFADEHPAADRAELLEALAIECSLTAQIDRAIAAREAALKIWLTEGDRRKEGENRCHLAILHWAEARIDHADREATSAIAVLESIPPGPELAMAYATFGRLRGPTASAVEGITWGERAIALAEQFHAIETLADALIDVGATRLAVGDDRGIDQIKRGLELASEAGLDDLVARAYHNLGFGFGEQFQFSRAAQYFAAGIAFCAERDLDHPRLFMTAWLAYCRFFQGEWDEATDLSTSVLEAPDVSPMARLLALLVAAMIRVRKGDPGATPLLDEALALASMSGSHLYLGPIHAARAESAWLAGDATACVREARASYDLAVKQRQPWYSGELAYWRWKGGDLTQPPSLIADPFRRQMSGDWGSAAAAWESLGCPYEAAWAIVESSDEVALRTALGTFERLGARPAAALARRRLHDLGVRGIPRGPRPATRANPASLTRRQIEILRLLAGGHGNREIADRLFISLRTVENHVSAILAKLGATSRLEAIALAERLGITSQTE
jgi:DNA-binding CsgD family transcriptional regulator